MLLRNAKDFFNQLNQNLAPLYFIYGDEPLQHQEAITAVRAKAKKEGYTESEDFDLTANADWECLKSLDTLPLFSPKRLITLRLREGKIGSKNSDTLIKLITNPPPETLLLICAEKLDKAATASNWFATMQRIGIGFCASPIPRNQLNAWVKERFQQVNLNASADAILCLIERTEGNLLATAQAIEKMRLTTSPQPPFKGGDLESISAKEVLEIIGEESRFSIYDLVDAILQGTIERTTRIFWCLKNEGVEPILILWAITREVRSIISIAKATQSGESLSDAMRKQGVWSNRAGFISAFLKQHSTSQLYSLLVKANTVDNILKGRAKGDTWHALFGLCLLALGVTK